MSSLLQHSGKVSKRGVHLEFYLTTPSTDPLYADMPTSGKPVEMVPCAVCNSAHERLHVAIRKPVGMVGCWVQFRINGQIEVPDLSLPIATFRLPRDAKPMTAEENATAWHRK